MENNSLQPLELEESLVRISALLAGSKADQDTAMGMVDNHLRRVVVAKIRRTAPSLSPAVVAEVYQETLLSLWTAAKDGSFDASRPILPFILMIAQRRATDALRKLTRASADYDILFDAVAERLADNRIGEAWQKVVSKEDGRRMMYVLRQAVAELPPQQRQVASAVIAFFPNVPSIDDLCQELRMSTGQEQSRTAVKRAWQEARKKLRNRLTQEGYLEH